MNMRLPKSAKLALGIFCFFTLVYLLFESVFGLSGAIESRIPAFSATPVTALILIGLLVADILIPIPASIVMVTSGILFGGWLGGLITLAGSMAGSLLNFTVSRKLGRERVQSWLGRDEFGRFALALERHGAFVVILTRMIPLAMETVSSISGISKMPLRRFAVLNLIGFFPAAFLYAYAGAVFRDAPRNAAIVIIAGFFIPLAIWHIRTRFADAKTSA